MRSRNEGPIDLSENEEVIHTNFGHLGIKMNWPLHLITCIADENLVEIYGMLGIR